MRTAGRALLSVVHGSVDAYLLDGLRGRSGQRIADGQIDRGAGLNDAAGAAVARCRCSKLRVLK